MKILMAIMTDYTVFYGIYDNTGERFFLMARCSVGWAIPIALGVHPPSPSSFAPWSSRRQVNYSHTPHRLPG